MDSCRSSLHPLPLPLFEQSRAFQSRDCGRHAKRRSKSQRRRVNQAIVWSANLFKGLLCDRGLATCRDDIYWGILVVEFWQAGHTEWLQVGVVMFPRNLLYKRAYPSSFALARISLMKIDYFLSELRCKWNACFLQVSIHGRVKIPARER